MIRATASSSSSSGLPKSSSSLGSQDDLVVVVAQQGHEQAQLQQQQQHQHQTKTHHHIEVVGDNDTSFEIDEPEDEVVDQDIERQQQQQQHNGHEAPTSSHSSDSDDDDDDDVSDNKSLSTPTNEARTPKYILGRRISGNGVRKKGQSAATTTAYIENEKFPQAVVIALPQGSQHTSSTTFRACVHDNGPGQVDYDDDAAEDEEEGSNEDLSDNSCDDSYTFSSTPTTADVADVSAAAAAAALQRYNSQGSGSRGSNASSHKVQPQIHLPTTHHQQQQHHHLHTASHMDDNISGSLATTTTTTEIDLDNTTTRTTASPAHTTATTTTTATGTSQRLLTHRSSIATASAAPPPPPPIAPTHRRVNSTVLSVPTMLLTHPSAALQENITIKGSTSLDLPTSLIGGNGIVVGSGSRRHHQRSLSAASHRSVISQHSVHTANTTLSITEPKSRIWSSLTWICLRFQSSGIGAPSVHHAMVVIFLEFFAWGLLTMPVISVLNQTFPEHTFLMNGLVMGIKGILSFLSAPLIGALSDIWGRKFFLLITVFFTCAPIPLMTINTWWFFAMISISGIFAVTFSVVFAYVADVTTVEERSRAYGLVSATFAASLVISPALGAVLMERYSDTLVVALATAIAVLDVFFILVAVPESLPDKVRPSSWGAPINWEQADPFAALRKVGTDHTVLMQCVTVLLSYLPEAGQYSCIFVYLKLKMGFNTMEVAIFIAVVGILSISVQVTLGCFMRKIGAKRTIILGLILEMTQLFWYGFGSKKWMMWAAGILAALGSITYPAISAFVSIHSTADSQGAVQGMVTGMRGLCNGLGPAMFGVVFYLFNVDLNNEQSVASSSEEITEDSWFTYPGPPFIFGGLMVILAILVAVFIPEVHGETTLHRTPSVKRHLQYEVEGGHKPTTPLMRSDSLAQL
ncbi:uncharacterized protein LOC101891354 isoform X2 [Musca domestica]|uniref:Uncharacterized protein LOC101891354 isoform X2 n=1 Tax=Musca domestica TaxID=7370 RepID=A0A1I8N9N5_MUSDO|nr:uncharacterized protein LOC101891354 isoform X2 [Musca domestica]